jgi:hypothetical protein
MQLERSDKTASNPILVQTHDSQSILNNLTIQDVIYE